MTTFTRTWNPAYEALPPDTENAKNGAERINETKVDTRERIEVDHSMAGDVDDGTHKKVTFVDPLASKPIQANDETYLYTKDSAGTSELFFEDESGNEVQLTGAGKFFIDLVYPVGAIYASTVSTSPAALFGGSWTALGDKQTLVQQGTYPAGSTGGSSTAVNVAHTHSTDSQGAHTHGVTTYPSSSSSGNNVEATPNTTPAGSQNTSSNGAHTHTALSSGVSGSNANMPPYISVYMWRRTA